MSPTQQDRAQHLDQTLQRLTEITEPDEAQAKLVTAPLVMAYEARYALQQLRESIDTSQMDSAAVFDVVQPIALAVGWAEALAFAFDRTAITPTVPFATNGKQK